MNLAKTILVLALLIPSLAFADSIQIKWDPPTTDSDGNPITETDISGYKLYTSTVDGTYTTTPKATTTETEATIVETKVGKYFAVVTAYNESGESTYSNQVTYEVKRKIPGAPRNLTFLQKVIASLKELSELFKIWV